MDFHGCPIALAVEGQFVDLLEGSRGTAPSEEPFGVFVAHVDTAVRMGDTKIIVPVGAMEGMTFAGEETAPGDAGQDILVVAGGTVGGTHAAGGELDHDVVTSNGGIV